MVPQPNQLGASFRDPAGFLYRDRGVLYRHVAHSYRPHYDRLYESGLYDALTERGWLVRHDEVEPTGGAYRTLRPDVVPYVSYPYEWCFSQLQDAALLTLDIQQQCLARGMTLKDASAYNIQFVGARPLLIDTLSFEIYDEGKPWVAYRQFCQHFLAPLALMAGTDVRLRRLLGSFIDGIPLDLTSALLPRRTWLRPGLATHVHLHARSQRRHQQTAADRPAVRLRPVSKRLMVALIDGLRRTVSGCAMGGRPTEWGDYYDRTNYSAEAMVAKERLVCEMVEAMALPGRPVHDLGANTGRFSRLFANADRYVVAHDVDELAVERNYRRCRQEGTSGILPLLLDLTSPSPALGWALTERRSVIDRMAGGCVVALALIHHLAISNNVPLPQAAGFFARIAERLVIEFVPKEDSQVVRLLATRPDIFPGYTVSGFEQAFGEHFRIERRAPVPGTARAIYAMTRRQEATAGSGAGAG